MYQSIIELKNDLPEDILMEAKGLINMAFDNRCGKVENLSDYPLVLVHQANEEKKPCLHIGLMNIKGQTNLINCIRSWKWIDEEDSSENCDVLQLFKKQKMA